jgi:hypothetical protein
MAVYKFFVPRRPLSYNDIILTVGCTNWPCTLGLRGYNTNDHWDRVPTLFLVSSNLGAGWSNRLDPIFLCFDELAVPQVVTREVPERWTRRMSHPLVLPPPRRHTLVP